MLDKFNLLAPLEGNLWRICILMLGCNGLNMALKGLIMILKSPLYS